MQCNNQAEKDNEKHGLCKCPSPRVSVYILHILCVSFLQRTINPFEESLVYKRPDSAFPVLRALIG